VRRAKRAALVVGAAQARKRVAAPRRQRAAVMSGSPSKAARMPAKATGTMPAKMSGKMSSKMPRKARIGKR
jgi:hypothetical protein